MISHTTEDYVKAIWLLQDSLNVSPVPMGELAKKLELSPGTVTTMVKSIAKEGLVNYEPRRGACLTGKGEVLALRMVRRHRLVELFLVETLKMDWAEVHEEAERMEHAVSDAVVERLANFLGNPTVDPHGDPIPGSDGDVPGEARSEPLSEVAAGKTVVVTRIREQVAETLDYFSKRGIRPAASFEVVSRNAAGKVIELSDGSKERFALSLETAGAIEVLVSS
ncbi:MAG: metal-dependent transcriptional regulator [Verrucomicrobiota bacterium]